MKNNPAACTFAMDKILDIYGGGFHV